MLLVFGVLRNLLQIEFVLLFDFADDCAHHRSLLLFEQRGVVQAVLIGVDLWIDNSFGQWLIVLRSAQSVVYWIIKYTVVHIVLVEFEVKIALVENISDCPLSGGVCLVETLKIADLLAAWLLNLFAELVHFLNVFPDRMLLETNFIIVLAQLIFAILSDLVVNIFVSLKITLVIIMIWRDQLLVVEVREQLSMVCVEFILRDVFLPSQKEVGSVADSLTGGIVNLKQIQYLFALQIWQGVFIVYCGQLDALPLYFQTIPLIEIIISTRFHTFSVFF